MSKVIQLSEPTRLHPAHKQRQQSNAMRLFSTFFIISLLLAAVISLPQKSLAQDAPVAPPTPTLKAVAGDGSVTLYWDDVAESHYDPFFEDYVVFQRRVGGSVFEDVFANPRNFQGYKVYKSTDPEFMDALRITNNQGEPIRFDPEVVFDLQNEITGYHPASIEGQRVWMGEDTGISRIYEDNSLINGRTYYYAVVSFTHGDALPELQLPVQFDDDDQPFQPIPNTIYTVPPKESSVNITVLDDGRIITGLNVVEVTPQANAAGVVDPQPIFIDQVTGTGSGDVDVEIIDPAELRGGNNYSVTFEDTLVDGVVTGTSDLVTKSITLTNTTTGETLLDRIENFEGVEFPVTEGLLFSIDNVAERVAPDEEASEWISNQESPIHDFVLAVSSQNPRPADYRLEIYDEAVSRSTEFTIGNNTFPETDVNVRAFNTTNGEEVDFAYFTNPQLPRDVRDVAYLSPNRIVAVGAAGQIQISEDGGVNWRGVDSGQAVRLRSVFFLDENNGWAAGREGVVIRTTDGGESWSPALETGTDVILNDIYFTDLNNGWVSGNSGTLLRTTDGGDSWQTQTTNSTRNLNDVHFVNNSTGFASGLITVLRTEDGGESWSELSTGFTSNFQSIYFVDESTGWITGTSGLIIKTEDGGDSWIENDSPSSATLNHIYFTDANTGWAVGQEGSIVFTDDAGQNWSNLSSPVASELFSVNALDASSVVAVGTNSVRLRSSDGGQSWEQTDDFRRFRAALDDNNQSRSDIIYILEDARDSDSGQNGLVDTWRISMLARTASSDVGLTVDPTGGDELRFITIKPFTEVDELQFSVQPENQPREDLEGGEDLLDDVRVVPNPYLVAHIAETGNENQLHFTNLPQRCSIRIFDVSGRLVQTLNVDNPPSEDRYIWNMRTKDNDALPYGVYIYHVDAPGIGEKVGKFAVIK